MRLESDSKVDIRMSYYANYTNSPTCNSTTWNQVDLQWFCSNIHYYWFIMTDLSDVPESWINFLYLNLMFVPDTKIGVNSVQMPYSLDFKSNDLIGSGHPCLHSCSHWLRWLLVCSFLEGPVVIRSESRVLTFLHQSWCIQYQERRFAKVQCKNYTLALFAFDTDKG